MRDEKLLTSTDAVELPLRSRVIFFGLLIAATLFDLALLYWWWSG
jgi:hypothetical protein